MVPTATHGMAEFNPKWPCKPHDVPRFHRHSGHRIRGIGRRSTHQQRMVWAPCPIKTNWGKPRLQLTLMGRPHTALPSPIKGQHVTSVRDAARVGQGVRAGRGMLGKCCLGPWQRIKEEPLDTHPVVPFVGSKEAEEDQVLPYPQNGGQTSVPDPGGK